MDKTIYIEFTKKDNDKRIVEGFASTEALDSQGEVVKLSAIEKALPDYMKFANLREMHSWSAVGKTIGANFDRIKNGLHIVGIIVDKEAWEKVKEGVYNGFSIGGRILKRVDNVIEELALSEISLVDRPANPEAVFTMIKIDNTSQEQPSLQNEEVLIAGHILDLAREIRMTMDLFNSQGKSIKELSSALTSLKVLAVKVLGETDRKKFDKILYEIDFNELGKLAKIPQLKVEEDKCVKNYVDTNWSKGYFEQLKKVLK
jgi:hypothetical protein